VEIVDKTKSYSESEMVEARRVLLIEWFHEKQCEISWEYH